MTSTANNSIQLPTSSGDSQLAQQLEGLSLDDKKVDYLSSLPNELIRRIFTLAYAEKSGPRFPLNKRLLPFHYERVFEFVTVPYDGSMHASINSVCSSTTRLGNYISTLAVEGETEEFRDPPGAKPLTKLFTKLRDLRNLIIEDADPVASLVLKTAFAQKNLPSLVTLIIDSPLDQWSSPYHRQHYRALRFYPYLATLALEIDRDTFSLRLSHPPPSPANAGHFAAFTSLSFSGSVLDKNAVFAILRAAVSLQDLTLAQQEDSDATLLPLLTCLPNPHRLSHLKLPVSYVEESTVREDIVQPLSPFSNLAHLHLVGPYDTDSPSFYTFLRTFPLVELNIGPGMPLSPSSILALFNPSTRHPSLKVLALSNIMAARGPKIDPEDLDGVHFDEETGEPDIPPGWYPPLWMPGWDASVVRQIAHAAETAGVDTDGTTFEAEAIDREYEEEEIKLELYLEMMDEEALEAGYLSWEDDYDYEGSDNSSRSSGSEEDDEDDEDEE
ncbi:hypothetical protein JCM10207_008501 [Rhodosporidiobolus poonsookiae]